MELRHLEAFYWIVRLGSFSAAAKALHTTQPAISMRMRELQRDLGVALFDTATRRTQITAKGWDLFDHAESMLNLASAIRTQVGDRSTLSGRVQVGVTETIALTWLPVLASKLRQDYPKVVLELEIGLTRDLWDKLAAGELDLVMVPGPVRRAELDWSHLGSIDYCWMASPSLGPFPRPLEPGELERFPIISLPRASSLHEDTERWFGTYQAKPNRIYFCNSLSVVAALTRSGLGVSLLPPTIFRESVSDGELRVLEVTPPLPALDFYVVRGQKAVSPLPLIVEELATQVTTFRAPGRLARME